jgi:hypothetical protein
MPYPMTRLCFRVGGEEFNSQFFYSMPRVVDMAEGSPGVVQNGLSDLMYLCGKAIHVSRRKGKAFKQVLNTPPDYPGS